MTDQFAFLGDKCKAAIAAMALGVLLLLPASLGYGGTIIEEAYGQFNLSLLEEEEPDTGADTGADTEDTTTTPTTPTTPAPTDTTTNMQNLSTYMMAPLNVEPVRGFIGSTLPTQGAGGDPLTSDDNSGHIVTGAFRLFANDTLVRRFVARTSIAAIDGSSIHNVTITEGTPHRFEVTEGNETAAASSTIIASIFLDGSPTPVIDSVPMTLTLRGQVLAIQGIYIDEARITDTGQRDVISVLDGQSLYGTVPR